MKMWPWRKLAWDEYETNIHLIVFFLYGIKTMKVDTHAWKIVTCVQKWNERNSQRISNSPIQPSNPSFHPSSADIAHKLKIPSPSCRRTIAKLFNDGILTRCKRCKENNVQYRMMNRYDLLFSFNKIHHLAKDERFAQALATSEFGFTVDSFNKLLEDVQTKIFESESNIDLQNLAAVFGKEPHLVTIGELATLSGEKLHLVAKEDDTISMQKLAAFFLTGMVG